jgi:hypothetical protein
LAKLEGGQFIRLCDSIYTAVNSSNLDVLVNQDRDQAVEFKGGEAIGSRENEESDIESDGDN